jgi:hypothetical protein
MGCDIHIMAEIKKNGKWEAAGKIFQHKNWKDEIYYSEEPYEGRNYNLFGILADVRNGRGFAGIKTGEGFVPISEPKGVPKDASKVYKDMVREWDGDGHSHSYFTVKELLAYDWNQYTMLQGCVSIDMYKKYKDTGELPDSYSGHVSGSEVILVDENDVDQKPSATHVKMSWTESYSLSAGYFIENTIPQLQKLGDPDDVRIVFFFDN